MARSRITRQTQLAKREDVRKQLLKLYRSVEDGFRDQIERSDSNMDYWDAYNCVLNTRQFYNSDFSHEFIPLIHNAQEARKTRFLNQVFPQTGRYLEVTTEDGEIPHAEMALLEMHVDRAELRTKVVPALLVSGDVEGQYTVCVTWSSKTRHVVSRETRPLRIGGIEHEGLGEEEVIKQETIEDSGPEVGIVADADFLILPVTADGVEDAIESGGSVTALCRWSESRLEELIERGEIDSDLSAELLVEMRRGDDNVRDTAKKLADAAGIKAKGKYALVYRTWAKITVGKERRLVLAYFGGPDTILGCKLCPYWCDKPDYLSEPVKKMPGVAKGMSPVAPCMDMQYLANDFANMAADSCILAVQPVVLTDPLKNPRVGSMVLDSMSIWETSPNDTKVLEFPPVYQHAFNVISQCERYINMTLGVSASMIPQSTGNPGRKRNQAEIALEQQVEILTTNVEVSGAFETGILTKMVQRFAEYDAQFRDEEVTVRSVGELGVKAEMVKVPPLQMGKRWRYRWFGVEAARTAQNIQQQVSALNVIKGILSDPASAQAIAQQGYRLNPIPFIKVVTESAFGPRLAPEIFENQKDKLALDPEMENIMLGEGFDLPVSPQDDDPQHLQAHMAAMQQSQDLRVRAAFAKHMSAHQQAMQMKQAAAVMQQLQQQMQGGGKGRGPTQGAVPQPPRQMQRPAGTIHPDQMKGVVTMPRKTG